MIRAIVARAVVQHVQACPCSNFAYSIVTVNFSVFEGGCREERTGARIGGGAARGGAARWSSFRLRAPAAQPSRHVKAEFTYDPTVGRPVGLLPFLWKCSYLDRLVLRLKGPTSSRILLSGVGRSQIGRLIKQIENYEIEG
jgi:hypothetical protein